MTASIPAVIAATVLLLSIHPIPAPAQESGSRHFRKGIFVGTEISAGMTAWEAPPVSKTHSGDDRDGGRRLMPDYGIGMFGGWRFRPQIAIAAGIEGSNSIVTGTTALPVFVRLRSDILDRKVSPMIQIDLGYAFQFAQSRRTVSELSFNGEAFPERYTSLGFSTAEEYISACVENLLGQHTGLSEEEAGKLAVEERLRAKDRLCRFANGQRSYLPAEALDELGCFSKAGFFGSLTAGISVGIGKERSRISAGMSAGIAQYSHSIPLRTPDNSFTNFSVPDALPDGTPVIIARTSLKDNPIRLELRLRISWEF